MASKTVDQIMFEPLQLPCGTILKNRLVKAAMSDALGNGQGLPTPAQNRLYARWAEGGIAASIIGEVQGTSQFPESPGNLVLQPDTPAPFEDLAKAGQAHGAGLWVQLGHAGALAHEEISQRAGPSAIDVPGLTCAAMTLQKIRKLPDEFARTARTAKAMGFGGAEIHAAHGFLLSQFLSPLFNTRADLYGGSPEARRRLVLDVISAVRDAVGDAFPLAIKINASDMLDGGLTEVEALALIDALEACPIDLIDISGGTYFPGAASSSDGAGKGPYFAEFARQARQRTAKPLMLTGGIKTFAQANDLLCAGHVDVIGLARALVLEPDLPHQWRHGDTRPPAFPKLVSTEAGAVTAWYTMRIAALAEDREAEFSMEASDALTRIKMQEAAKVARWKNHFSSV
ncbi:oxidoreductase [uncultured Roseobacter sp.]|uniref:oxidoreductase n=1 Tax=uncultured Roseobacter sp. TaxID=114847 RepID=UPI0026090459|nr:oxidoreductase [uncultured Roseobacter sp.]